VGCTPSSLGPVAKISQLAGSSGAAPPLLDPASDTNGHCSTSLKNARVAVGSVEYTSVCEATIIPTL
jgi:hypothetical protein